MWVTQDNRQLEMKTKTNMEENRKMNIRKPGKFCVEWIHHAYDTNKWWAGLNTIMNIWLTRGCPRLKYITVQSVLTT
jgi:hypothetical protein